MRPQQVAEEAERRLRWRELGEQGHLALDVVVGRAYSGRIRVTLDQRGIQRA